MFELSNGILFLKTCKAIFKMTQTININMKKILSMS